MWNTNKWNLDMNLKWDPEELEQHFQEAFQDVYSPGPDVDKTVSLSGGLDSTLIMSILRNNKISGTSCSWDDDSAAESTDNTPMFDESYLAGKTCEYFDKPFHETVVPYDFNHLMKETYEAITLPIWDRNRLVPRYMNCKTAAETGHKVYMVGDVADELLTGYNGDFNRFYPKNAKTKKCTKDEVKDDHREHMPASLFGNDHINNWLFYRTLSQGESFCIVADHLAGSFGMESRVPFLHQRLAKYILKIPGVYKLHVPFKHEHFASDYKKKKEQRFWRMGNWKSMLRDHMAKYYPNHILNRTRKIGFANPWDARDDKKNDEYGEADTKLTTLLNKKLTFKED